MIGMCSSTSKFIPTDMKIHGNSLIKNVKYCTKEINIKCFYLPFTRYIFYLMLFLSRPSGSRDFSPYCRMFWDHYGCITVCGDHSIHKKHAIRISLVFNGKCGKRLLGMVMHSVVALWYGVNKTQGILYL